MDKTDKPKSVREVLDKLVSRTAFDVKGVRDWDKLFAQALADIYSLLGEDIKDADCSTPIISPREYVTHDMALDACEPEMEGQIYKEETAERCGGCIECVQAQANALWRKHLQERLR